jgi:hypothetical protein
MVGGHIHRVGGDHDAAPQVKHAKAALIGVAPQDMRIRADRQASRLQLGVALIGPEPRHGVIGGGVAQQRGGCGLGLIDGVLHAFQPEQAPRKGVGMQRAVPHGKNIRVCGAPLGIGFDPVRAGQTGRQRQFRVRHSANANQHQIGGQVGAIRQDDGFNAGLPFEAQNACAGQNHRSHAAMHRLEPG